MSIPTLESIRALNGRNFATLSPDEHAVFDFYAAQGRKFQVEISIVNDGVAIDLDEAASRKQAEAVLKAKNSKVSVVVGAGATEAWAARSLPDIMTQETPPPAGAPGPTTPVNPEGVLAFFEGLAAIEATLVYSAPAHAAIAITPSIAELLHQFCRNDPRYERVTAVIWMQDYQSIKANSTGMR